MVRLTMSVLLMAFTLFGQDAAAPAFEVASVKPTGELRARARSSVSLSNEIGGMDRGSAESRGATIEV